ncbi:MAG: carboxypeptidase regulatory-like domain-containing protein [Bacteroidales bacterium]|nr:carboxypeptidase regulatory-like domain-containing protein [Bacteroidales bacterium]
MQKISLSVMLLFLSFKLLNASISFLPENGPEQGCSTVKGIVIDKITGETLVGVKVVIEGIEHEVYTDFDGRFEFTGIKPGKYNVICNLVTYQGARVEKISIDGNSCQKQITLFLTPVSEMPAMKKKTVSDLYLTASVG